MVLKPPYEIKFLILRNYFAMQHWYFSQYKNRINSVKLNQINVNSMAGSDQSTGFVCDLTWPKPPNPAA